MSGRFEPVLIPSVLRVWNPYGNIKAKENLLRTLLGFV